MNNCKLKIIGGILFLFIVSIVTNAADFSSTDYTVTAPVLNSGEYSTSNDYQLFGNISQIAIGSSTASGAYQVLGGFLYFPEVTAPVPTATAGNGQVSLSWTAATAAQGWSIGGYNVGQSTVIGGPYTYASVGNVTNSTRTGLTNGTAYYFIVRAEDALGNSIATSSEVSATPKGTTVDTGASGKGGGGAAIFQAIVDIVKRAVDFVTGGGMCVPNTIGDVNCDGFVDLVDFSILAFWHRKSDPPKNVDITSDGIVELADFSVVAYYWTNPKQLRPFVVKDEQLAGGQYTLLLASDNGDVDHYEILETKPKAQISQNTNLSNTETEWVVAESPYVLQDQDRTSDIYVRQVDMDGSEQIAAVLPALKSRRSFWLWIIGGFIATLLAVRWKYRCKFPISK